jgi:hypothetical protein
MLRMLLEYLQEVLVRRCLRRKRCHLQTLALQTSVVPHP